MNMKILSSLWVLVNDIVWALVEMSHAPSCDVPAGCLTYWFLVGTKGILYVNYISYRY